MKWLLCTFVASGFANFSLHAGHEGAKPVAMRLPSISRAILRDFKRKLVWGLPPAAVPNPFLADWRLLDMAPGEEEEGEAEAQRVRSVSNQ